MKFFNILIVLAIVSQCYAQSPNGFSFQAVLRDGNQALIKNQNVGLQISILNGSETGPSIYTERHTPKTNTNGLVSIVVGKGSVVSGNFNIIKWSENQYFIKTETDFAGGNNYTLSGTSPLLPTPFATIAKSVEKVATAEPLQGGGSEDNPLFIMENGINSSHIENQTILPEDISTIGVNGSEPIVLKWIPSLGQWGFHPEQEILAGNGIEISTNPADPFNAKTIEISNNGASENDVLTYKSGQWRAETPSTGLTGSGTFGTIPLFSSSTSITNSVIEQNSGNIGIGTNPEVSYKLIVGGNLRSTGSLYLGSAENFSDAGSYQIDCDGTLLTTHADWLGTSSHKWAGVWASNGVIQTSDEKMKKDINPISDGITKIKKLRPVSYNWKNPTLNDKKALGFIAQELLEVVPESVVTEEVIRNEDGTSSTVPVSTLGVNYSMLIPVLTKAIQEQQVIIESLTDQIKAQQNQLNELIKKMDSTENK